MRRTIQFQEYLYIAKKKSGFIAGITLLALLAGIYLNYYVLKPVYEASTTLIINAGQEGDALDYGDIVFNREIVTTCTELVKSKAVTGKVFDELDIGGDYQDFADSIAVKTVKETGIIKIIASSSDANEAATIANRLAFFFKSEASSLIGIGKVGVMEEAEKPSSPEKPRKLLNIGIAGFLAAVTGFFWVYFRESVNDSVISGRDVERLVGLRVIGVVPNFGKATRLHLIRESRRTGK